MKNNVNRIGKIHHLILNELKVLSLLVTLFVVMISAQTSTAQWVNPNELADLNTWPSQSGFMGWYNHANNTPAGQGYGCGIQISLPQDTRFGAQIVIPTFDNEIFYRKNQAGTWDSWTKVWSSVNLNKDDIDFNCKNLYANGNLWAKEIKVAITNPWPDYVFKPDYDLLKLSDLKTYIDHHHHLPDLPTASQVEKEGINLGEINAKLLKKIEELTLHLIEKDKQIEDQGDRIRLQEEKAEKQEKTLKTILRKIGN